MRKEFYPIIPSGKFGWKGEGTIENLPFGALVFAVSPADEEPKEAKAEIDFTPRLEIPALKKYLFCSSFWLRTV